MSPDTPPREVAAIGAEPLIAGLALAGVRLYPARDPGDVRAAWVTASARSSLVVLTADAAQALGEEVATPSAPLTVVVPA